MTMPTKAVKASNLKKGDMADITIENLELKVEQLAAENAALKSSVAEVRRQAFNARRNSHNCGPFQYSDLCDSIIDETKVETPITDAILAEVRASVIPEGYVLVPQEMHLPSEAMEGICFHCGDGNHQFGEFTDGTLFVGEVDYGDGKKVHGLHIATADYPEEGCSTVCEFAAQLRQEAK